MKHDKKVFPVIIIMFLAAFSVSFCLLVLHNVMLTFIAYYFICCISIPIIDLVFIKKQKFSGYLKFIGFSLKPLRSIITGIAHGLVIYFLMLGVYFYLKDKVDLNNVLKSVQEWGMPNSGRWIIFFIVVLFNGLVEEVFWRGYCFTELRESLSAVPAIMITTIFYTSYHLVTLFSFFGPSVLGISLVITVFSAGILWGILRNYFNDLWAPAIGHILATCGYMTIFMML